MVQDRVFSFGKPIEVVSTFTPFESLTSSNRSDILREMEFTRQNLLAEIGTTTITSVIDGLKQRVAHIDSFISTAQTDFPDTVFNPTVCVSTAVSALWHASKKSGNSAF